MSYTSGKNAAGKDWAKQTVIIETQDAYPKKVALTVFGQERIEEFNLKTEEVLTFSIDVESREYGGRWYTDVKAYAIKRNNGVQTPPAGLPQEAPKGHPSVFPQPAPAAPSAAPHSNPQTSTDLPF